MSLLYQYQKKYQLKYQKKIKEQHPEVYKQRYDAMLHRARENYDDEKKTKKKETYLKNRNYRTVISGTDLQNLFLEV